MQREHTARSTERLIRTLVATVFLEWMGSTAIIPLLPVYVRRLGGTDALAGLVMAAFFAAGVLTQYPAGKVADRVGRRPVLIAGLVVYSVSSFAFLLPVTATWAIALRSAQGVGAGAATVASLAMVAGAVSTERRGRAFAFVYGAQIAGMAIGPLIGSIIGIHHMNLLFLGSGTLTLVACIPASRIVEPVATHRPSRRTAADRLSVGRATLGGLVAGGGLALFSGLYDLCWSLLLISRGASSWEIGLSWTLFAAPFVILARPAGWMADHLNRKGLVIGGTVIAALFCVAYPFIHVVPLLMTLGAIEAAGYAAALPALQSLLAQGARPHQFGRIQGSFATVQTAVTAAMAAAAGALFAVATWIPFLITSVLSLAAMVVASLLWRQVTGRVGSSSVDGADSGSATDVISAHPH